MTPKEKAKELVNRFKDFTKQESYERKNYNAIECALIAVDEIINSKHGWNKYTSTFVKYWQEVKQEIENL